MTEKVNKVEKEEKRFRSGGFPTVSLEEAINIIKKGSDAGWDMSKDTFAKAIGGSTAKSGAFLVKLASIRDYGLIERGGNIQYTQLAREIIAPKTDDPIERQNKLREAFFKSDVFKMLYEKIKDGPGETSIATVANLGLHDFRVSVLKKDVFAQNFILSAKHAGLIEDSADGKVRIIRDGKLNQKIKDGNPSPVFFGFSEKSPQDFVNNYSGNGWMLNIKTDRPLNSKVKRKLFEISELLDGNEQE